MPRPSLRSTAPWLAPVLDLACVLIFAALGRRSHAEASGPLSVLSTAWPFVVGLALGWAVLRWAGRRPEAPSSGLVLVLVMVPLAMLLRSATDRGVAISFIVVASVVLALLLAGWRSLMWWAQRRSARSVS